MLGRIRNFLSKSEAAPPEAPPLPEAPAEGPLTARNLEFLRFDEILTYRSFEILPVLEDFEAPFDLGEGRTETLILRNRTRAEQDGSIQEYTAEVTASAEALAVLQDRYGPTALARGDQPERRSVPRILHRIRVRSRHLPSFQAITHDMTMQGLRLIVEGEVAPDTALDLDMQLDHDRLPNVKGQGVAVWSAPSEGRTWWLGVRITSLEDEDTLQEYLGGVGGATDDGLTRKNFLD